MNREDVTDVSENNKCGHYAHALMSNCSMVYDDRRESACEHGANYVHPIVRWINGACASGFLIRGISDLDAI